MLTFGSRMIANADSVGNDWCAHVLLGQREA